MFYYKNLDINEKGNLTFNKADTVLLAKKYQTPLYVMDEDMIRENCRIYKKALDKFYDKRGLALYASKAFSCKEIYRIVASEGLGCDVVSGGELYTALEAGFDPEKIYFHGNNKTKQELIFALEKGVGHIVLDGFYDLEVISEICEEKNIVANVSVRIKPGIDAHTHDAVMTGQIDSKFGVALETGEAKEFLLTAIKKKNINLRGVHCHLGSQIFDLEPFEEAARRLLNLMIEIRNETGYIIEELNLGGGFGIKYTEKDDPIEYASYIESVSKTVKNICNRNDFPLPFILMEPGRSIVAPCGITLYTVGSVKKIPGIRTYVSVDGGMADNPRYALYNAEYEAVIANKAKEPKSQIVTIAGRCCESGDLIGENIKIQKAESGDIMAVLSTGAYNYSMASHYNRLPNPPVVMIKDGEDRVIVKGETYEDIVKNDI
ncbi:MAG: diaminopimelate decarboxylase [Clostridia bacterium]|nr:diaminopimelate decarboxylase [Clostridia bacterium]